MQTKQVCLMVAECVEEKTESNSVKVEEQKCYFVVTNIYRVYVKM